MALDLSYLWLKEVAGVITIVVAAVKLGVGMHAFPLTAPVALALINEPIVDLFHV